MQQDSDGKAIASLVLGILSVLSAWNGYSGTASIVMSVVGIVLASMSRKAAYAEGRPISPLANWGLGLSVAGIVIASIAVVACIACVACIGLAGGLGNYMAFPYGF